MRPYIGKVIYYLFNSFSRLLGAVHYTNCVTNVFAPLPILGTEITSTPLKGEKKHGPKWLKIALNIKCSLNTVLVVYVQPLIF